MHHMEPFALFATCGAPLDRFATNGLSWWGTLGADRPFVNCPECLIKAPPKRKRAYGFQRGKKFR